MSKNADTIRLHLKKYITVSNQIAILENYYNLKRKNSLDYRRLELLDELQSLRAKRTYCLRLLVQIIRDSA